MTGVSGVGTSLLVDGVQGLLQQAQLLHLHTTVFVNLIYQMRIICIKICLTLTNCPVVLTLLFVSVLKILIFEVISITK
jgi:hypothetical protein